MGITIHPSFLPHDDPDLFALSLDRARPAHDRRRQFAEPTGTVRPSTRH
ncbi:hypothetical protein ACIBO2_52735 [Nonomuraea sp. NPDC050022]